MDSLLIIIASRDREKILTALLYAGNAYRRGWFDEVEVIFFGPSEKEVAMDRDLQQKMMDILNETGLKILACKAVADGYEVADSLSNIGIDVMYVGEYISNKIKKGVKVLVW